MYCLMILNSEITSALKGITLPYLMNHLQDKDFAERRQMFVKSKWESKLYFSEH